ncbi:glycoside hydrolase family 15 protein [Entomobacter blattae]|uniref:Trehalase n=1 Tax=Entomobacter blattae TaxID=2762277 RepID=A0A7H1NSW1_9PROT|nr:glycoside hydrolase family 15 protein [Entomobacter blattae]QNT78871.1 Trehalase [Entomobacter blattae]
MASPALFIEDYAMIGDGHSCALVGLNGSIDWLCWPRFDSAACFAALLGNRENGHWQIMPVSELGQEWQPSRFYHENTNILETVFTSSDGNTFSIIDFMAIGNSHSSIVRIVECKKGKAVVENQMRLRFDYGRSIPWVSRLECEEGYAIKAVAGPQQCVMRSSVPLEGKNFSTVSLFTLNTGEKAVFTLSTSASYRSIPPAFNVEDSFKKTKKFWQEWSERCHYEGLYQKEVMRSLLVLKAMIYEPTGGIVAAPTTSLPETIGGSRNWDYRYCWLRDSTLTLIAMIRCGYHEEADSWRGWFRRAIAGTPAQSQIMYGLRGERQLNEWEVPWLSGYENSLPVRIGNGAAGQIQLDIAGEMAMVLHLSRKTGLRSPDEDWYFELNLLKYLEHIWHLPDEGMWEIREKRQHFTFSKVSCWVAFDRAIHDAIQYGLEAPIERWKAIRDRIHQQVCEQGFDKDKNSFVQFYGGSELDATLLLLPVVNFLPITDPKIQGTVSAIEKELLVDGFVQRYRPETGVDGLDGQDEGVFLACSFWLVDVYILQGRKQEAVELFERVLSISNELGLLSEEYDVKLKRLVGNFPQAFSHLALINTALHLNAGKVPVLDDIKTSVEPSPV